MPKNTSAQVGGGDKVAPTYTEVVPQNVVHVTTSTPVSGNGTVVGELQTKHKK
jgi:hypothetical protein